MPKEKRDICPKCGHGMSSHQQLKILPSGMLQATGLDQRTCVKETFGPKEGTFQFCGCQLKASA